MPLLSKFHRGLTHLLERLLIFIEALLGLRLILKFLIANPDTFIVQIIYDITQFVIWPFNFIFPNIYLGSHTLDMIALTSMVGYLVIFFILQWFLRLLWKD